MRAYVSIYHYQEDKIIVFILVVVTLHLYVKTYKVISYLKY